ncbi:MAG: J domain-containing protein [Proteobacteria bacterium]|nr:J domain-containing protein [Pseudomonadota bacterium]
MAPTRTIHVKCPTWEQVEVFYTRKLRKGRILSMKVPYPAEPGEKFTLGLELPNELVIAIDGRVAKAAAVEGDPGKTWIEVELVGWTEDVVARLKAMALGEGQAPPPPPPVVSRTMTPSMDALPSDERALFQHLSGELRRLRQQPVHEVLGVASDAGASEIRAGWMTQVRRHHPDLVARRGAPAITHLAEELTILSNRAYDRLRAALVAEGRGRSFGPAISTTQGWLVGWEDIATGEPPVRFASEPDAAGAATEAASPDVESSALQGGESFEARARTMLGEGDANTAQEVLAAALCVYPRSRPLRSLYYVASAMTALEKGEVMLATSQLEAALAHHEACDEAAKILDHVRKHGADDTERVWRMFAARSEP